MVSASANRRVIGGVVDMVSEYLKKFASVQKFAKNVLFALGSGKAVSITLSNNHPQLDMTEPHWYIKQGKLNTPPPAVLKNHDLKEDAMVITIEEKPEGLLIYKLEEHCYLLILWSVVSSGNKFLVEFVEDPFVYRDLFDSSIKRAWTAGKYGEWYSKTKMKYKVTVAMGNGGRAPLEVFVTENI